jgi:hypothetical protein
MLELKLREASVSERNVMSGALLVARIASDLMTNSVQQNLAWEADSRAGDQEISSP